MKVLKANLGGGGGRWGGGARFQNFSFKSVPMLDLSVPHADWPRAAESWQKVTKVTVSLAEVFFEGYSWMDARHLNYRKKCDKYC